MDRLDDRPQAEMVVVHSRAEFLSRIDRGSPLDPDRNPALRYLAALGRGGRPTQLSALRRIAEFFWKSRAVAAVPWEELRYVHVQALRSALIDTGAAPSTANRHLSVLRSVLRECVRLELMGEQDYRRAIDVPAVRGSRVPRGRALTHGELRALFAAARQQSGEEGIRNAAALGLLYGAGLRRAELVALDLDAVGPNAENLRIRGKGNKERVIPLPPGSSAALRAYLAVRGAHAGALFHPTRWAHALNRRRRLSDDAVVEILRSLAAQAGTARFTPHDLRRTFVGDLLDAGADLATVQTMAGHSKPETTARYDRRGERTKVRAAALLLVPYGDGGDD